MGTSYTEKETEKEQFIESYLQGLKHIPAIIIHTYIHTYTYIHTLFILEADDNYYIQIKLKRKYF